MIIKEREYVTLYDLVEYFIEGTEPNATDIDILSVVDEHGNSSVPSLDVVIEITREDGVDKDEETPEETNTWLKEAGF